MRNNVYREEMDALAMSPDFRRRLVDAMAAQGAPKPRRSGRSLRLAAAAAAVCALLAVGAAAFSPTLREALAAALGGFAPYAQAQEGTAVDRGIRVQVVSALADSYNMQVYAEVSDLTGDRLSKANFGGTIDMDIDGEMIGSYYTELIHYDPETKTALLRFSDWTGGVITGGMRATLKLGSIQPDYHDFDTEDIPLDLLTAEIKPSLTLDSGESVIAPGLTEYALAGKEGDGLTVSSAGFTSDGRLHILFRFPEGTVNGKQYALCSPRWNEARTEKEGGNLSTAVSTTTGVRFELDGAVYYDNVVEIGPADLPDIVSLPSATVLYSTQEAIKGDWEIPITFTKVEEKVSPISGQIDNNTLTKLRLSPMNVIVESASDDFTQIGGYPLTVFLSNGTSFRAERGHIGGGTDWSIHLARWVFDEPIDVNTITGVAIGAWYIPVENGAAGAGYWLSEAP